MSSSLSRGFRRNLSALGLLLLCTACGGDRTKGVRAQLVPPADQLDFGAVPVLNTKTAEIPVQDVGRAVLKVVGAHLKEDSVPFTVTAVPAEVPSGETLPIGLSFLPTKEADYSATLVLETADPDQPLVEVKLLGKGSTRAIMEVDPVALDFGRVGECGAAVKTFSIRSKGSADLIIEEIAFAEGTSPAFSFVGSTKTPSTVKTVGSNGLQGQIELTVKYTVPAGSTGVANGAIRVRGTDPDQREVTIALTGTPNRAPIPDIKPLGNGAPGLQLTLDGSGSTDPEGDLPLLYKWTLRSKPIGSTTTIAGPEQAVTSMTLDPTLPGEYEVELNVTDSQQVKNCTAARSKVVAAPAQKLLVEMFWNNARTDIDLHVLRTANSQVGAAPDDCYYANPTPDWGLAGDSSDDPQFLRDALSGYGPEVLGYVNPIDASYRLVVEFAHDHLDPNPATEVTVRVYEYGVVKGEFKKTLAARGDVWSVADLQWPSGVLTPLQ